MINTMKTSFSDALTVMQPTGPEYQAFRSEYDIPQVNLMLAGLKRSHLHFYFRCYLCSARSPVNLDMLFGIMLALVFDLSNLTGVSIDEYINTDSTHVQF